jgi:chromosome transmission fidelity protein 4
VESDEPTLYRIVDGIIRRLEVEDEATSECVWHPDGRAFACATATRDITTVSVADGAQQRSFIGGHMTDILSLAWSANGALLATCSRDGGLVIWETKTQSMIKKFDYENTMNVTWHPQAANYFNWTTSLGEVYICPNFLKDEAHVRLLQGPRARAPFFHDPLDETAAAINGRKPFVNGRSKPVRAGTPDSLDILLGVSEEEDWIEDDDGAGYINGNGKRPNGHLGTLNGHTGKRGRQGYWSPQIHEPFQPGATPWRGNRKYLCLNLIGFVWTVDQDSHHTVTVEFYDRELHRDFHFTDPYLYDKACLNEKGTLFSCPSSNDHAAMVFYRPHETWTSRADWRTQLPEGEEVTAIALSKNFVTVLTTKGYVRVYTLFGTPYRMWRQKSGSAVTCAAFDDYVLTVGNGTVGSDGCTQLVYSIEDVRREEVCQNEDVVAVGESNALRNVFFSDEGDPCIYDSSGTLLVLAHWRSPNQAKWVPLLDTTQLERLASGRKEESYWPVAVAQGKFHCIILKGGDQHPYFPRPLLSEFDFKVPVTTLPPKKTAADSDEAVEESNAHAGARLEESFVRSSILHSLLDDVISAVQNPPLAQRTELTRRELEIDKILLQLLAVECREGEERGMKALEIVGLMRDRGGKMIEAAGKVAGRWGRVVLEEKIREVGERRLMGLDGVDEEEL